MAVTKDLTKAIPTENSSNRVTNWYLEYTYENDSDGDSTYYKKIFVKHVPQTDISVSGTSVTNFTLQAKGSFSKANLVSLCPVSHWDTVFANMVDQAITNPTATTTVDTSFSVPS
mgnify:CR=1 FL=1